MEFAKVVRSRRMVRHYTGEPVAEEGLARIMDTARRGPSAGFSQGLAFVVVTEADLRSKIAHIAEEPEYVRRRFEPWLSSAPVHVVCCVSEAAYRRRYEEPDKRKPSGKPRAWPVPYWYVDGGCALMLLLLAAVDEGLAAGFLDLDPQGYVQLRRLLDIPEEVVPIGLVTLGYPAPDRRSGSVARGLRPLGEVVHRNHWGGA
ncbi:MAG: nitroreductase family protein [Actinobacteria bacterium]|nr:nitroreductase family protein [Actinomycetota bacterium]